MSSERLAEDVVARTTDAAGVLFTRAKRTRSFEDVVEQIRTAILEGRLKEGDRLANERDLCRVFGISRSTLREGLRTLEALGVVEIRPGASGGIFVSEFGGDQIGLVGLEALIRFRGATTQDLAEFRVSFEGETVYWAALRRDERDVETLDELVREYERLAAHCRTAWPALTQLDLQFHEAIARASKNQIRVAIMLGIHRALYQASLSIAPFASDALGEAIASELAGIAEAVRGQDGRLARTRMRRHVKKFADIERMIQHREFELATHAIQRVSRR